MMQIFYWSGLSFLIWLLMSLVAPLSMRPSTWNSGKSNFNMMLSYALAIGVFGALFGGVWLASIGLHTSVIVFIAMNLIVFTVLASGFDDHGEVGRLRCVSLSALVMMMVFYIVSSTHLTQASRITNLLDVSEIDTALFASTEESNMRVMPKGVAFEVAKKALGKRSSEGKQLGAIYTIDRDAMTLQYLNGSQYWVVPLAHGGLFKELRAGTLYGYVKVKADVADYEPELVEYAMLYAPSASFSHNIKRLVVSEYPTRPKFELKFMIAPDNKPVFVQMFGKAAVGMGNYVFDGGVIINPVTGEMDEFEYGDSPEWMDYSISETVLLERLNSWGEYRDGWANAWFGSQSKMLPTSVKGEQSIFFVDAEGTSNGKAFFTGLSNKSGNNALAGMVYADPITGQVSVYYPDSTASPDEDSIISQVDAALGIDATRWSPTEPIPYRVYDTLDVWLTPIISQNGVIIGYGFSDVNTPNRTVWDKDLSVALSKMLNLGTSSGAVTNSSNTETYHGTVRSYVLYEGAAHITIYDHWPNVVPKVFECDVSLSADMPECLTLTLGEKIEFDAHSRGEMRSSISKIESEISRKVAGTPDSPAMQ